MTTSPQRRLPPLIYQLNALSRDPSDQLTCEPLGAGDHNQVWRVRQGASDVVVRLPQATPHSQSFYRAEIFNQMCAGQLGIAPRVVAEDVRHGLLVSEFVAGRCVQRRDFECDNFKDLLVHTMRRLHNSGHWFLYQHDFLSAVAKKIANAASVSTPGSSQTLHKMSLIAERFRSYLSSQPVVRCPIHADLALKNMMLAQDRLCFIDWEVSGMGDPLEELAFVIFNSDMSPAQAADFMARYFSPQYTDATREAVEYCKAKTVLYWLLHIYSWAVEHQSRASEADDPSYEYACRNERLTEFRELIGSTMMAGALRTLGLTGKAPQPVGA